MTQIPDTGSLSVARNIKIATFHLGSGMADVLTTGVWNRLMISDLGVAATPVGLLLALRYFLAPVGIWAGRQSDMRLMAGYRRLFWIWLGRLLMVISTVLLGLGTAMLVRQAPDGPAPWAIIALGLVLFSVGSAVSGTTFLALIYDRAGPEQRGRAVGIVWTFLLLGFTVAGVLFGAMLPTAEEGGLTAEAVLQMFLIAAVLFAGLWFFSLLGEEQRGRAIAADEAAKASSFRADLRLVWRDRRLRFFLLFLCASMFFAFFQDLILEPFAADVFGMEARVTNRFAAYWGSTAILATLTFLWLSRRYRWLSNTVLSFAGVLILLLTFLVFAMAAAIDWRWLVTPGLVLLGLGLGLWNVGLLGLMMDMSPAARAGTFLGFWTVASLFSRGTGLSAGGFARDIALGLSGDVATAYAMVFTLGALGLGFSLWLLGQVHAADFIADSPGDREMPVAEVMAGAMD
jgi:MFS transporter, BCD family, chlorophyll transporter